MTRITTKPRRHGTKGPDHAPQEEEVAALIKLQINAGQATPAPPIGPALGQHGVNIMEFCKAYNAATESQRGNVIPVEITVFEDRSFTFVTKTPPAAELIKKAAGVDKGSGEPHKTRSAADARAGPRDRPDQARGPQRQRPGRGVQDHRRHRPLDGHHRRGLSASTAHACTTWQGQRWPDDHDLPTNQETAMKRSKSYRAAAEKIDADRLRPAGRGPAGQGDVADEVRRDRRGRVAPRRRPPQGGPVVRGTVNLPHGTGKTARVLVFATGERPRQAEAPAPTTSAPTTSSSGSRAASSTSTPPSPPPT